MDTTINTATAAERGILSSVFSGKPEGFRWANYLTINHFHDVRHKLIFSAIYQFYLDSMHADKLMVKDHLTRSGLLETAGGEEYLQNLNDEVMSLAQIESYVKIVRKNSLKHKIEELGNRLVTMGNDYTTDPDDDLALIRREVSKTEAMFSSVKLNDISMEVEEVIQQLMVTLSGEKPVNMLQTGLQDFDNLTGGFSKGELIILGARPSMGKTGLALSIVNDLIFRQNKPVAWFSLEMSAQFIVNRLLSIATEIEAGKISRGQINPDEYEQIQLYAEKLKEAPFYIIDEAAPKIERIATLSRQLKEMHGVELIVVDYLQLVSGNQKRYESRELEISSITKGLRKIARELNVPVLVMSQLSRAVETRGGDKKPILSDMRESGAIEQDADKVLFLYRAEYYGIETDWDGRPTKDVAEIIVAKNRFGPVATAYTRFIRQYAKFTGFEFPELYRNTETNDNSIADEQLRARYSELFIKNIKDNYDTPF